MAVLFENTKLNIKLKIKRHNHRTVDTRRDFEN